MIVALLSLIALYQEPADLVLENVRPFDPRSATVGDPTTLVVREGRIASLLEPGERVEAERTVDGRGRLVVPGFVDTHIHLQQTFSFEAFTEPDILDGLDHGDLRRTLAERHLAYGSTTVCDMGQPPGWVDTSFAWGQEDDPGIPNLLIVGSSLCSHHSWDGNPPPHHRILRKPEDIEAVFQEYADLGLTRCKLYWKLRPDDLERAVAAAGKHGIVPFAHIDNNIASMWEALELGVKNYEHFFTLVPGILEFRAHRGRIAERYGLESTDTIDKFAASMVAYFDYVRSEEDLHLEMMGLLETMAEEGATLSTALNVLAAAVGRTDVFTSFDPFPERTVPDLRGLDEEQRARLGDAFDSVLYYVGQAHELGVKLRIGTDCREGGPSLLAELGLLAEAGIPLGEVLRIATLNGAEALGVSDRLGTLDPGQQCDLVILHGDPFEDLTHLQGPRTVIKAGVVYE